MSKAVPGDGQIRRDIEEASKALSSAMQRYFVLVTRDEAKFRNNLDQSTAFAQLGMLELVGSQVQGCIPVLRAAHKHHVDQRSVLPNNAFGLGRRIHTVNGEKRVKVEEMAKAKPDLVMKVTSIVMSLPVEERGPASERALNPGEGWNSLGEEDREKYLRGQLSLPPVPPLIASV